MIMSFFTCTLSWQLQKENTTLRSMYSNRSLFGPPITSVWTRLKSFQRGENRSKSSIWKDLEQRKELPHGSE